MTTTVDLKLVQEILADAQKVAERLDGTVIDDTTLGNKAVEAQLNRELLNLSSALVLAASLVKNEYWSGKGLLSYDL